MPPIIISDGHDLLIYSSVEHATSIMELEDVNSNIVAYDCLGHRLSLDIGFRIIEKRFLWIKWKSNHRYILITGCDPPINDSQDLREKLIYYLSYQGKVEDDLLNCDNKRLIEEVGKDIPWKF